MKLKQLIITGFKSFADRTEFEFDEGVSCVVGPNGCGKSNIVDAIKWVLGEQSAKSLRGDEMMDVIFNGSSTRRPSGQATVTLVFDNRDGLLQPTLDGEVQSGNIVTTTRRLYRSGQSEYLINNTPCRMRDIKEMFLDTGIGTNAYSLVEQGRISQFLQAGQDERRAFFDEAAGISRYKSRKKEALRKLQRVEQNLLRLTDIVSEVEKRLRSIKYQAGKARNYQVYSERLKELRSLFFLSRYHLLRARRKNQQTELDAGNDRLAAIQTRIGQLDSAQSAAEVESVEQEQTARDTQSRIAVLAGQITTLQERVDMQTKRVKELSEQILVNSHRCEELEAKVDECAKDLATRQVELNQVSCAAEKLQQDCDNAREEHAKGVVAITRLEGQLEDEKTGVIDLLRRTAQLHNDVHTIGLRREGLRGEQLRLAGRAEEIAETLKQLLVEHAQEKARLRDTQEVIDDSQKKLDEVKSSSANIIDTEQRLVQELSDAREQRSSLQGRMHTLQEMQERLEGVAEGTRRVLRASRESRLPAIRGMLSDYIETDVEHAHLVEAALAGTEQLLLADSYANVQNAMDELENLLAKGGSIEVFCLDRAVAPLKEDVTFSCPQSVGCILEWISFEPWLEPAMRHLLGRTLVVPTLADATLAAETAPAGYRFVTLNGDVLEADGRIRLGAASRPDGVIARRSELAELQNRRELLEETIGQLQRQSQDAHEEREHLDQQVHSLRTAIYEASFERDECTKHLGLLDDQISERKREEPLLALSLKDIEEQIDVAIRTEHETEEKASELERIKAAHNEAIEKLEAEITASRARRDELAEKRSDLRAALAATEQKKLALHDAADALQRQGEAMGAEHRASRSGIELDRSRREEAESDIHKSRQEVDRLYETQQLLQVEAKNIAESRQGLADRLDEISTELSQQRLKAAQVGEKVGDLRVKLGELDAHISDLISRASDEMQMNLIDLYTSYEHDEQRDWDEVEREIGELRGKIDRLGNVNLDAISEQEELEQRRSFLTEQLDDIHTSQRQLEELIRKLNKESCDRFTETFTAVRENYQTIFRKLFNGGKADIFLTDPQNVLESGIEIVARPPGKELRSISLLSGGEKTLAALAMIFSFFRAKPSPFCLLDEVDAALDEANNERYNLLVKEFVEQTQFIMISHAKRTMSIANVLYGITMQEPGVSKRISVRFEQVEQLQEALQPAGS